MQCTHRISHLEVRIRKGKAVFRCDACGKNFRAKTSL